jgi:hypothetical protein
VTVAPLPVSVLASPSLVCQGYPSTLTAISAGTSYTWQPNAASGPTTIVAPTANTIYTVSATDGTCSGTQTLAVNTKVTPTITAAATATSICGGQAATLTASGAGAGGTYSWTPTGATTSTVVVTPTVATMYNVLGTNSLNCQSTAQQIVLVVASPQLSVTANKTLVCEGSQAILSASGAGGYSWANGPTTSSYSVNPTTTTVYTVTGTHTVNTCVTTKTIMVSTINPSVTVVPAYSICEGNTATLSAIGASSYTWSGNPGSTIGTQTVTPSQTTTYTLQATTQSLTVKCVSTHTAMVTVNPNPTETATFAKNTVCRGEAHTITAGGATTYSWSTNATTASITVSPSVSTTYTLTGISGSGCASSILVIAKIAACNSINELDPSSQLITVYPNPNNGVFTVKSQSDITLKLINSIGQEIRSIALSQSNDHNIQVSELSNGVYFLIGESDKGKINQKIIIAK